MNKFFFSVIDGYGLDEPVCETYDIKEAIKAAHDWGSNCYINVRLSKRHRKLYDTIPAEEVASSDAYSYWVTGESGMRYEVNPPAAEDNDSSERIILDENIILNVLTRAFGQ